MLAYNIIYLVAHWYARARDAFDVYITKPCKQLKQQLIDDNAIEYASLIEIHQDQLKEDILINLGWINYALRYLQMCFFGKDWTIRKRLDSFVISDLRLDHGAILYVKLANGKEYLTDKPFYSTQSSNFSHPKKKYLCILLDKLDISLFIYRFWTSWNALNLHFFDFILLSKYLDSNIRRHSKMIRNHTCLTLVDDDDFSETYIGHNDCVHF